MNLSEMNELIKIFTNLDISLLTVQEQCTLMSATEEMLEKVKPILVKNAMKNGTPSNITFLFKLQ